LFSAAQSQAGKNVKAKAATVKSQRAKASKKR
jgi:hypothetical protein